MSDKSAVNPQLEAVHDIEVAANWVVWSMEHGKDPARTLRTLREKIAAFQSVTDVALHDLTPSEVTAAKILAAYCAWVPIEVDEYATPQTAVAVDATSAAFDEFLEEIEGALVPNETGRALLDRARRAGVL